MESTAEFDVSSWLQRHELSTYTSAFETNQISTRQALLTIDEAKFDSIKMSENDRSKFYRALTECTNIPEWLRAHGLEKYQDCMHREGIDDWEIIRTLDDNDLDKLCFRPTDKKRFFNAVSAITGQRYRIMSDQNIDKALSFIKDWVTSLMQIQAAAIGAVGIVQFQLRGPPLVMTIEGLLLAASLICFLVSLFSGGRLLLMLPASSQRKPASFAAMQNDIHALYTFPRTFTIDVGVRDFRNWFFFGILFFTCFVLARAVPIGFICSVYCYLGGGAFDQCLGPCTSSGTAPKLTQGLPML